MTRHTVDAFAIFAVGRSDEERSVARMDSAKGVLLSARCLFRKLDQGIAFQSNNIWMC